MKQQQRYTVTSVSLFCLRACLQHISNRCFRTDAVSLQTVVAGPLCAQMAQLLEKDGHSQQDPKNDPR